MAADFSVVLVRTHLSANLGAAARVAKNFGVEDLRVVEPAAAVDTEADRIAAGADDLLRTLRRYPTLPEALSGFDAVVATSSLRGRMKQTFLSLSELPGFLGQLGPASRTAIVFGPERSGLTEEERSHATACLRLPTSPAFPTLNVSHAVACVLATVRAFESAPEETPREPWASAAEIDAAVAHWDRALEEIGFYETGHRGRSLRMWRRLIASRPLTETEVAVLRGVANRILVALKLKGAGR